jgi:exosortase
MLALGLHLLSVLLDVYFTSGFSILILIFGLSLYLLGWPITRRLLFPIGFLVFMFPLPIAALETVSTPMKLIAVRCGTAIVSLLGIPVVQEGFHLHFSSASLVIGNPCSGLRSLIALLALGSLFAYFFDRPMSRRIGLLVATIPIAVFCNIVRVIALSLVANSFGSEVATGLFHDLSGFLAFVLALVMLFGLGRVISTGKKV